VVSRRAGAHLETGSGVGVEVPTAVHVHSPGVIPPGVGHAGHAERYECALGAS